MSNNKPADMRLQQELFVTYDRYGRSMKIGIDEAAQYRKYFLGMGKDPRLCDEIERAMTRYVKKDWTFVMVNAQDLESATRLMLKMKRAKHCLAIYNICIANLEFASARVDMTQHEIAEAVGILPNNASICMVQMQKAGLICAQGLHGTSKRWYVSPAACWMGDEITRRESLAQFRKLLQEQDETERARRKRPGPKSAADKQLDADVISLQDSIDRNRRELAGAKCADMLENGQNCE